MKPQAARSFLVDTLLELGAAAAGVVLAQRMEAPQRVRDWLSSGQQAGMDYLSAHLELKQDPENLLAGVKSIVCAAFPHPVHLPPDPPPPVAGYAIGEDYHVRVRRVLVEAAERFCTQMPGQYRVCVDTAPLPERHLALQAGLGFAGTNGCLIVPSVGPNVVLGEILFTQEIEPTEPALRPCARCNRCIRFCPTGALSKDGVLDARLCLSYYTTASREEPPPEIFAKGEGRFFGCETCVSVCPHVHPDSGRDLSGIRTDLPELDFWKKPEYKNTVFADQPAWRLRRNRLWAQDALNTMDPE